MTNCGANTPRGHQFAMADYGSALDAAFTRRLALVSHNIRGNTQTVVDEGIADGLWEQEGNEQISQERPGGSVTLNPRAADLQAICMCIFGGSAFSTNVKLPGSICDYFQWGHADPFVNKVYRYDNGVTTTAVFSASDTSTLLNLVWNVEFQSRQIIDDMTDTDNWPALTLSNQQPFVFRQGVLKFASTSVKMKDFNLTVDNLIQADDFFNSLTRGEMPQGGQQFTLTHSSPWDVGTEADRIGTAQDIAIDLDFVSGTKRIRFEFPKMFAVIDEPEISGRARILNQYVWRAKHDPDNAIAAPVRITVVTA